MKRISATILAVATAILLAAPAWAVGTDAGTPVSNRASVQYTLGTSPTITAYSSTVTFIVAELVDAVVAWADASTPVSVVGPLPTYGVDMVFTVSNVGNGVEDWTITVDNQVLGDDFQPDASGTSPLVYRDNGDAVCDTATDTLVAGPEPITADSVIYFCVYNDFSDTSATGPADGERAWVSLTATSTNAAGGSVQVGAGDGTGDLVLAAGGGTDTATGVYQVLLTTLNVVKSYAVADSVSSTGTEPIPGAVITYTIDLGVQGTGTAQGVVVTDPYPANTTYVPGSLNVLPAPVGAAAGATNVTVDFGNLDAAAGTQRIIFQVTID